MDESLALCCKLFENSKIRMEKIWKQIWQMEVNWIHSCLYQRLISSKKLCSSASQILISVSVSIQGREKIRYMLLRWQPNCCASHETFMPFRVICSLMSEPICSVEMSCICRRLPITYKKRGTNFLPDSRVTTPNISYKLFHAVAITAFGNFLEMLSSKKEDFVVNESQGIVTNAICRLLFYVSSF